MVKTSVLAGLVIVGLVATLLIDSEAVDVWLAGAGGLLAVLGGDVAFRRGWGFGILMSLFFIQIAAACIFAMVLFPIGEVGQEFARSYIIAAVAGLVGLGTWLVEVWLDK